MLRIIIMQCTHYAYTNSFQCLNCFTFVFRINMNFHSFESQISCFQLLSFYARLNQKYRRRRNEKNVGILFLQKKNENCIEKANEELSEWLVCTWSTSQGSIIDRKEIISVHCLVRNASSIYIHNSFQLHEQYIFPCFELFRHLRFEFQRCLGIQIINTNANERKRPTSTHTHR